MGRLEPGRPTSARSELTLGPDPQPDGVVRAVRLLLRWTEERLSRGQPGSREQREPADQPKDPAP